MNERRRIGVGSLSAAGLAASMASIAAATGAPVNEVRAGVEAIAEEFPQVTDDAGKLDFEALNAAEWERRRQRHLATRKFLGIARRKKF